MGEQDEYMREELFAKTGIKTEELAEGEYAKRPTRVLNVLLTDCSVSEIWVNEADDASLKQVADCYVSLISYDDSHPELFFSEYYVHDEAKKFYHVKEASLFTMNDIKCIFVTVDKSATFRRSEIKAGLAAYNQPPRFPAIFVKDKRIGGLWVKQGGQLVKPSGVYIKQNGTIKKM